MRGVAYKSLAGGVRGQLRGLTVAPRGTERHGGADDTVARRSRGLRSRQGCGAASHTRRA